MMSRRCPVKADSVKRSKYNEIVQSLVSKTQQDVSETFKTMILSSQLSHHDRLLEQLIMQAIMDHDTGRNALLYETLDCGSTLLHLAWASRDVSTNLMDQMITRGGKDFVVQKNKSDKTALDFAFLKNPTKDEMCVIEKMIEMASSVHSIATTGDIQDIGAYSESLDRGFDLIKILALIKKSNTNERHKALYKAILAWDIVKVYDPTLCRKLTIMIKKLIDTGGKDIISGDFGNCLHKANSKKLSDELMDHMINVCFKGKPEISIDFLQLVFSALSYDSENIEYIDFVDDLIRRGGKDFVMSKDQNGFTALDIAMTMKCSCPLKIVDTLLEIGGKDLLFIGDYTLHEACMWVDDAFETEEVVKRFIRVGGKELLFKRDDEGMTALHMVCVEIQTPELLMKLIKELLRVGGRELLLAQDNNGESVLFMNYLRLRRENVMDMIDFLLDRGGKELFQLRSNEGYTALQNCMVLGFENEFHDDPFAYFWKLLKRGIQFQVGGYFGVGGLFTLDPQGDAEIQFEIWDNWDMFSENISDLSEELLYHQPCLHAAILSKSPSDVISFFLENYQHSLFTVDNQGRFPIHVAMEVGLSWEEGMEEIVTAYSSHLNIEYVFKAAKYGLKWNEGMRQLLKEVSFYEDRKSEEKDVETGLYLFQVAAMGEKYDLDSVYEIARRDPQLVAQIDAKMVGSHNRVFSLKSPNNEAKRQKLA